MCAIAGILGLHFDVETTEKMMKTMRRRGPDDTGICNIENGCLLHTRLAVIDPKGGKQPMTASCGNALYTITYNGELYNTAQIRKELCTLGHCFETSSDTEVVLHGYMQWGERALEKYNGIFAFAIYEHHTGRIFLARDRMGVKPLFYKMHSGGLLFASEIKTLLAYPTVHAQLDAQGVAEVILLGPGRTPGCGVFRGIDELKPGHCAYYDGKRLIIRRYWRLLDRVHTDNFAQTVEKVRALVKDAIKGQMISDVPIGTFLSGGLDSSLITSICTSEKKKEGERISTFSLDYDKNDIYFKPGKFQPNADGDYIRLMENELRTDHRWTILDARRLVNSLEDATKARDLPGMADVDSSLLCFCNDIRKSVKVALSGECADEIFGGYPWYRDPDVQAIEGFPWAQNTKYRASFLQPNILEQVNPEEYVADRYHDTIMDCDILPENKKTERRMKEMVNLNQNWFMQTLLDRKDRMSMYHGLEVRVPFCDHRIAEYMYGVPWEFKDYKGVEKGLLRIAMTGFLPKEVLWRKKSPYPKTYDPLYLEIVADMLRKLLKDKTSPLLQIVRPQMLLSLLESEYAWPWYGQLMKVPQTIAYMLQIDFWLREYQIELVF